MSITLPNIPPYFDSPRLEYSVAQKLQVALQTDIAWLDRAYNIAKAGINSELKTIYPQIQANDGTKEHFDIRPDASVAAYCFFEVDRPTLINKNDDEITCFFSIVFWCNLDLIDDTLTHDFTSQLIQDVVNVLEFYEAENLTTETRPEKIFDKYNGLTQELKQFLMRRYSGFKMSFEIKDSYSDTCNPDAIDTCQMNIDRVNNLPTSIKNCVIAGLGGGGAGGTINVYLDGVLNSTTVSSDLDAEIVNISL